MIPKRKREVKKNPHFPNIQFSFMMLTVMKTKKGDCMMESIVKEKLGPFKGLEQKIFRYVCELGCGITRAVLAIL